MSSRHVTRGSSSPGKLSTKNLGAGVVAAAAGAGLVGLAVAPAAMASTFSSLTVPEGHCRARGYSAGGANVRPHSFSTLAQAPSGGSGNCAGAPPGWVQAWIHNVTANDTLAMTSVSHSLAETGLKGTAGITVRGIVKLTNEYNTRSHKFYGYGTLS